MQEFHIADSFEKSIGIASLKNNGGNPYVE
jgi:hypothetical protein